MNNTRKMHGTTIVAVHKDGVTAIAGDGQVTLGDTIMKKGAVKVRALQDGKVLVGFAGVVSDAFTLLEKFEGYLDNSKNNLLKAAVDTVKEWRTDKMLRDLEAMLIAGDKEQILVLSGNGDVILPDNNVLATGSGGIYAQAAALALLEHTDMSAMEIVKAAMKIATDIDIYSSGNITVLSVGETNKNAESSSENSTSLDSTNNISTDDKTTEETTLHAVAEDNDSKTNTARNTTKNDTEDTNENAESDDTP